MATEVHCLVKLNGNQLELASDVVANLMGQVSQVDYIVVLCTLGAPSSAKTSIMNATVKHFRVNCGLTGSDNCPGFMQPKKAQNEGQRFDGILVSTPLFIIQDNLGRRVAVILLDLWNNGTMSEEVYGKLLNFCFQVSSVQVFTLFGPLRQLTWWNGSFDVCSTELKQIHSHLLSALQQWLPEYQEDTVVAVKTCWTDETEYLRIIIHGDESGATVNLSDDFFPLILTQIFGGGNTDRCSKPLDLKDHLVKCVTTVNSSAVLHHSPVTASHLHHNVQGVTVDTETTSKSQYILQTYKKRLLQAYSESSQLFLEHQELKACSNGFSDQLGIDPEEAFRTCGEHYGQLKEFHNAIHSSFELIENEVGKILGEALIFYEKQFASGFKKHLEDYKIFEDMKCLQDNFTKAVDDVTIHILKTIGSSQCPLKEVEILSSKLKHEIRQKLLQNLEALQKQLELVVRTYCVFKSKLDGRIQRSICLSEEEFEEAAEQAWEAMESSENGIPIRPLLFNIRDEAAQEYERRLREQNGQNFHSEMCLAKQATDFAADVVLKLLTDYLKKFGVLTDRDIRSAFTVASTQAKKAFISAPGFNHNPPWHEALISLPSVLENQYSEIRQINLNAIRRWDRALESALRRSAEFYSQQMDRQLPPFKVSLKEIEKMHEVCAEKTVAEFTVGSEVNEPTKKYWKELLMRNQLQEWKEGYVCVNDDKNHAEEVPIPLFSDVVKEGEKYRVNRRQSEESPKITKPKTPPPQSQLSSCPIANVGVYFGPEIVIFTALRPDGEKVQVRNVPFALCSNNKILCGHEAIQAARNTGQLVNIFSILIEPTVPLEKPCDMKFNGESVCLTAEALSVLFFKTLITEAIVRTGCGIGSCGVALPGLLSGGAKTAVKEALKLAGFSKVVVVPITTALALPVALSLGFEWRENTPKKIVTIYHAGSFLEAALLHASPGKLEVKKLHGSLNLLNVSNPSSYTGNIIEKVATKDLFATMTLIGDGSMSPVEDGLVKALDEMDSLKFWIFRYGSKENGSKNSIAPVEISVTMATLDESLSGNANADGKVRFPDLKYLKIYDIDFPNSDCRFIKSNGKTDTYKYYHRTGTKGLNIHEGRNKRHWNYKFHLNPQSPNGPACSILYFRDGTFRIQPPTSDSPGVPVHSTSSKLFTVWDQETVRRNVERVVKLMATKDAETISPVEAKKNEGTEVQKTQDSVKFRLSQLVHQVEDGLENSGISQGPVYDFINESLQECRQILQNPMSTDQSLNMVMRKLGIRSSELLQN